MKASVYRLLSVVFLFSLISCSKDDDGGGSGTGRNALVTGTVVTPSGKAVSGAKVSASGTTVVSRLDGTFSISLAPGEHTLTLYTGSGNIFKTQLSLSLEDNEQLALSLAQTRLEQIKQLAYIPGQYDMIQVVIVDSLGYNATQIGVYTLDNPTALNNFGAIFLNCGLLDMTGSPAMMNTIRYQNLLDYVNNHGSLYASDYAVECLTGDGNLRLSGASAAGSHGSHSHKNGTGALATCWSPMLGGFIADSALCTYKSGPDGFFTDALVLDANLISAIGNDSIDIHYNLEDWEIVSLYDAPFTPIITHPFFGAIALKADLNPGAAHGNIYYTTFHNEPQGVNNDVEAILNYIILNL